MHVLGGLFERELALDDLVLDRAVHARGLAGAALIDEQDVAIAAQRLERLCVGRIKLHGTLARPTRQRHDRVGLGLQIERRHHGHSQRYAAGVRVVRVQRPFERAAARFYPRKRVAGADAAILEFERRERAR